MKLLSSLLLVLALQGCAMSSSYAHGGLDIGVGINLGMPIYQPYAPVYVAPQVYGAPGGRYYDPYPQPWLVTPPVYSQPYGYYGGRYNHGHHRHHDDDDD